MTDPAISAATNWLLTRHYTLEAARSYAPDVVAAIDAARAHAAKFNADPLRNVANDAVEAAARMINETANKRYNMYYVDKDVSLVLARVAIVAADAVRGRSYVEWRMSGDLAPAPHRTVLIEIPGDDGNPVVTTWRSDALPSATTRCAEMPNPQPPAPAHPEANADAPAWTAEKELLLRYAAGYFGLAPKPDWLEARHAGDAAFPAAIGRGE